MGEKRKNIGDFSVLKRVLKVERDTELTLQSRRRIYEEKIAQTRLEVDTLFQDAYRRIIDNEKNLKVKIDRVKEQIKKEFEAATHLNICKIKNSADLNRDLAIDHIIGLLESNGLKGNIGKGTDSDKRRNEKGAEGTSEGAA